MVVVVVTVVIVELYLAAEAAAKLDVLESRAAWRELDRDAFAADREADAAALAAALEAEAAACEDET